MRVRVTGSDLSRQEADLGVCFAYEGELHPLGVKEAVLCADLAREMKAAQFRGNVGDRLTWSPNGRYPCRRVLVVGLGARQGGGDIRVACARAAAAAQELGAASLALRLPDRSGDAAAVQARAAAEGVVLGAYRFDRYIGEPARRPKRLRSVEIGLAGPLPAARVAVARAEIGARAVCLARDWVNEAPSRLSPRILASQAQKVARGAKLRCKVLGPAELRKIGMGALLAVGRGSVETPRVVHLVYRPSAPARRRKSAAKILLVGKGVTFDSGGLNLKPGASMLTMKGDMAGAAAVLATMGVLGELGCTREVHGLLGLVENMTGGAAYKPGDILETWSGKTVEVADTDAEGRLVLCDLLAWGAKTLEPTAVVDLATLTSSCVVALGLRAAGLFARSDALRDELLVASSAAGEKLWPLPLYDEYLPALQKGPADLRNIGSRWGGAITAALFLGEFVPREMPWAHLDIAGPSFTEEDLPEAAAGGTGAGVLTLLRWLEGS